jgi:hypothetical protein
MNDDSSLAAAAPATKACPMCGETILAAARKCKFCKSELQLTAAMPPQMAPLRDPERPVSLAMSQPVSTQEYEQIGIGSIFGLGLLTLGIFGIVKFYQSARLYEKTVNRASSFATLFWLYIIVVPFVTWVLTLVFLPLGVFGWIADAALGGFVLREVLELRHEVVVQCGLTVKLKDPALQIALWVASSIPLVGLITMIVQTTFFFEDHNRIVAALQREALP